MKTRNFDTVAAAACALVLMFCCATAAAQSTPERPSAEAPAAIPSGQEAAAVRHVADAATIVQRMFPEPRMRELLQQAKGVFVVPRYGRAAIGVGVGGGTGVLMIRRADGAWSEPAFYNIGGVSAGVQVGAEAGPIALVLNNEKAVNKFMQKNQFSLNADAGLTVVNWSKAAQGSVGEGDVVFWAGTNGLYGNLAAIGVNDIRFSQGLTDAYYHQSVMARDVLEGKHTNPHSAILRQALSAGASAGVR